MSARCGCRGKNERAIQRSRRVEQSWGPSDEWRLSLTQPSCAWPQTITDARFDARPRCTRVQRRARPMRAFSKARSSLLKCAGSAGPSAGSAANNDFLAAGKAELAPHAVATNLARSWRDRVTVRNRNQLCLFAPCGERRERVRSRSARYRDRNGPLARGRASWLMVTRYAEVRHSLRRHCALNLTLHERFGTYSRRFHDPDTAREPQRFSVRGERRFMAGCRGAGAARIGRRHCGARQSAARPLIALAVSLALRARFARESRLDHAVVECVVAERSEPRLNSGFSVE